MTFYTVKEAIRGGHRLKIITGEGEFLIEPHVLGRDRSGKTLVRALQLRGPRQPKTTSAMPQSDGWRSTCRLSRRARNGSGLRARVADCFLGIRENASVRTVQSGHRGNGQRS